MIQKDDDGKVLSDLDANGDLPCPSAEVRLDCVCCCICESLLTRRQRAQEGVHCTAKLTENFKTRNFVFRVKATAGESS